MESEPSPSPLPSITTNDEFEGIEVAEFDANTLWELLYNEPQEEEAAPQQAVEVVDLNPNSVVESYWCLDDDNNDVQDFDWLRIMEETSTPCNGIWYGEACMEEVNQILEIGDYSFSHTSHAAVMCDEIGYIRLWNDS